MDYFDPETAKIVAEAGKSAMPAATTLIKPVLDIFLTPRLAKIFSNKERNRMIKESEEKFDIYLKNCVTERATIKSIVFHGIPVSFSDLYIPLTISHNGNEFSRTIRIERYGNDFFKGLFTEITVSGSTNIIIKDNAGMGKSTIIKCMLLECIQQQAGIPILIELRKLRHNHNIKDITMYWTKILVLFLGGNFPAWQSIVKA